MEQARYTFNFCIKKSRSRADGMAPIYLRVTVDCDRKEKASNLFVEPTLWDARFGLSRGTDKYSTSLNSRLSVIRSKMLEAYTALSSLGELPSTEAVINKFLGVETRKKEQHFLLDLFRDHNEKCAKLAANNQMADGTVERYVTSYKHTRDFIRQRYGLDDIEICMIDRNFIDDYEFYLKTKPTPCSHNSTVKYLKNFHKIVRLAVRLKYIAEDPFMHKQLKLEEVHPEFLEEHELAAILKKEFRTQRLS